MVRRRMARGNFRACRPKPSLRKERGEVGLRHAFLAVRVCACMFENAGIFFGPALSGGGGVRAPRAKTDGNDGQTLLF